jgi:protein SCO1
MKLKASNLFMMFLVLVAFTACRQDKNNLLLPVYGEKKANGTDTVYHTIQPFELTNQYGEKVSSSTVQNKIYVANFFFATCQSICPEMSTNLVDVQEAFAKDDSVLILSHSVNPLHDTVAVLQSYAMTYGAKKNKWHLLTGDKKQIYGLAKNSYLVNALEDDGTPEGFLHSELLLLVDTKGRLRGMYDGTNKGEVKKLISDIRLLKKESAKS